MLNPPGSFKMWPAAQHKLGKTGIQENRKKLIKCIVVLGICTLGLVTLGASLQLQAAWAKLLFLSLSSSIKFLTLLRTKETD